MNPAFWCDSVALSATTIHPNRTLAKWQKTLDKDFYVSIWKRTLQIESVLPLMTTSYCQVEVEKLQLWKIIRLNKMKLNLSHENEKDLRIWFYTVT